MELRQEDLSPGDIVYEEQDDVNGRGSVEDFDDTACVVVKDADSGVLYLIGLNSKLETQDGSSMKRCLVWPPLLCGYRIFRTQNEAIRASIEAEIQGCENALAHAKKLLDQLNAKPL